MIIYTVCYDGPYDIEMHTAVESNHQPDGRKGLNDLRDPKGVPAPGAVYSNSHIQSSG